MVRRRGSLTEIVELSTTLAATIEDVLGVKVIAFITTREKKNAREKN